MEKLYKITDRAGAYISLPENWTDRMVNCRLQARNVTWELCGDRIVGREKHSNRHYATLTYVGELQS